MQVKRLARSFIVSSMAVSGLLLGPADTLHGAGPVCSVPDDYATIQGAVNDAGCLTIHVGPGVYLENVAIGRTLALLGNQAGNPVSGRTFGSGVESLVTGAATAGGVPAFRVTAPSVTIDGFSITDSVTAGAAYGIAVAAAGSGALIRNNILDTIMTPDPGGNGTAQAIYLENGPDNVSIRGNSVNLVQSGRSAKAVLIGDSGSTNPSVSVTIEDNVFQQITSLSRGGYGVQVNNGSGATANSGLIVRNNTISNLTGGGWAHAIGLEASTPNASVSGNTITNISAPGADRIAVWLENTNPSFATGHANGNNLAVGTTAFGAAVDPLLPAGPFDATCNWWGAATGPTASSNPGGTGSLVSSNVVYQPWLIASAPGGACIGGNVPHDKDQCKGNGWKTLVRADGTTFKNQGDCIQYVNTGK
jgi:hypothetical protein